MTITTVFFRRYELSMRLGALSGIGQIGLVKNDTGPCLTFIIKDCEGNILTPSDGVSGVNLYLRKSCSDVPSNCGHVGTSGLDPDNGKWVYCLSAGDISGSGTYFGDLEIVFDDGRIETGYEPVRIFVRDSKKC